MPMPFTPTAVRAFVWLFLVVISSSSCAENIPVKLQLEWSNFIVNSEKLVNFCRRKNKLLFFDYSIR